MVVESPPTRPPKSLVRSVARTILWPIRRFFDPRFAGIHDAVQDVKRVVVADMDAANEAATLTGRQLDNLLAHVEPVARIEWMQESMQDKLDQLFHRFLFEHEQSHTIDELDELTARVLNFGSSHEGFAAQANLWFNPSVLVSYGRRRVEVAWVNERVAELPYTFAAVARVPAGGKVLDVGATESTVSLSLATLGYEVTAIDPRPNPLSHERLHTVVGRIEELEATDEFDAVICLSTIEHLGTGDYGEPEAEERVDLAAMERMHAAAKPDALLVLTTSVAREPRDEPRAYDRAGLDELLEGWTVEDLTLVQRRGATAWDRIEGPIEELEPESETVAMITATKTA